MVDTSGLGPDEFMFVRVQIPPGAPICQSGRIGRDAKTIGTSYVVSVRASYGEGATEDIAGSNPASDTKLTPGRETSWKTLLKCMEERFME